MTTLFWGAGATLQFLVLAWANSNLGLDLSKAAILQGVVAIGIAIGAVLAAAYVSLRRSVDVLPIGVLKEKLLAAKYAKIKEVLVPAENKPDIQELDKEITDGLTITFVSSMKEVLNKALV